MQIHRYRAKTINEATAKVKNDLGADAMILSSKKLTGQANGPFFEIAAVASDAKTLEHGNVAYDVRSELMSIKEMMYILNHSGGMMDNLMQRPATLSLYVKMLRNGINEQCARMFMEKGGAFGDHSPADSKTIRLRTAKEVLKQIGIMNLFDMNGERIVTALIGTTGVGKTTTVAKLAAKLVLKNKKKVGLISIDGYRIGAMEQIKTYANILGIPCFPAFNRKDLIVALEKLKHMDVVLIDTAGQSQYDRKRIEELKNMMTDDLKIDCHLLLSLATSGAEMNKIAMKFSLLKFKSYIFTKLDESRKYGSIINQLVKMQLPISYLTTGQNVPEDIEQAQRDRLLKLLLNRN